jgi:hypothetical protein
VIFHAILALPKVSPITLNSELLAELERIINKALEKDRHSAMLGIAQSSNMWENENF